MSASAAHAAASSTHSVSATTAHAAASSTHSASAATTHAGASAPPVPLLPHQPPDAGVLDAESVHLPLKSVHPFGLGRDLFLGRFLCLRQRQLEASYPKPFVQVLHLLKLSLLLRGQRGFGRRLRILLGLRQRDCR
jgi:hypothetical protein